jgi:micrococcal nuclease
VLPCFSFVAGEVEAAAMIMTKQMIEVVALLIREYADAIKALASISAVTGQIAQHAHVHRKINNRSFHFNCLGGKMGRNIYKNLVLISSLLFLFSLTTPQKTFEGHPAYKVIRVVDGDTVILEMEGQKITIRLMGVDTPETVHPAKPVEAYGREASNFLKNLLSGESVYLEYESGASKLDKYGRTLAYLYRSPDGLFVNLEIIRQGYGHAYTKFPFQYMDLFREHESHARETGKGLWSNDLQSMSSPVSDLKGNDSKPQTENESETVYITKTGAKYHRDGCHFLSKSKIPITLKDAKARGYGPCSVCNPPQ